jgi:DNA-binding transcriptional LysR family regulator
METTAAVRLPSVLARYHAAYPSVQLALRTGPTASLVAAVLDGELEAAFVAGPIDHPDLAVETAFEEELVLVTSDCWTSLAALRAGTPESGPTALSFRTGCSYRQRLDQALAALGWPCPMRLEFGTLDGILGCVSGGMGVTLLPRAVVERSGWTASVRAHTLDKVHRDIKTLLIRRRTSHESSSLLALRACLATEIAANAA